jgi:acetyltransferase-like isoleucine patch superfamily enzyme
MNNNPLSTFRSKLKSNLNSIRLKYLKLLGLKAGKNCNIGRITSDWPNKIIVGNNCTIQDNVDFRIAHPYSNENMIQIGDNTFIGRCVEFNSDHSIIIGNNVLIASNTTIVDVGHQIKDETLIRQQPIISKPIRIEDDVWIGTQCVILQGVTIGKGSVVGAGSIVNKSIPEYQVWAGSPAKFIRNRY